MKAQACLPCAKRKVRCDRKGPCSNCKRRKGDKCTYLDVSPNEHIKKLKTLVRDFGGDPGAIDKDSLKQKSSFNVQNLAQTLHGQESSAVEGI